jgi:hypothetical protein
MEFASAHAKTTYSKPHWATRQHAIQKKPVKWSTLLHATVYMFLHKMRNVLAQVANKMGLRTTLFWSLRYCCLVTYCWLPRNEINKPLYSNGHFLCKEINKPLHSNGNMEKITDVGGSHSGITEKRKNNWPVTAVIVTDGWKGKR